MSTTQPQNNQQPKNTEEDTTTTNTDEQEHGSNAPEPDTPQATEEEQPQDERPSGRGNQEAARYRVRLRETEAQLEAAQAQIKQLQQGIIEDYAATAGIQRPDAIWKAGFDASDLISEDGTIDRTAAVDALKLFAKHEGLAVHVPRPDPAQVAYSKLQPDTGTNEEWSKAFKMR